MVINSKNTRSISSFLGYIDKLFGSNQLRIFIAQKKPPSYLSPQYMHDEIEFSKFREKFLLY